MNTSKNHKTIQLLKIGGLVLAFAAYFFVPYQMISSSEKVLKEGTVYRFKPRPVDPGDVFRGKYVRLRFPQESIQVEKADSVYTYDQPVYVTLKVDSAGYAHFDAAYSQPPAHTSDYIQTTLTYVNTDRVTPAFPFEKYYMNEKYAQEAENQARKLMRDRDSVRVYIDVRVKDGQSAIEELYFDGMPVMEFLRQ